VPRVNTRLGLKALGINSILGLLDAHNTEREREKAQSVLQASPVIRRMQEML
jgi:hypothetical protein